MLNPGGIVNKPENPLDFGIPDMTATDIDPQKDEVTLRDLDKDLIEHITLSEYYSQFVESIDDCFLDDYNTTPLEPTPVTNDPVNESVPQSLDQSVESPCEENNVNRSGVKKKRPTIWKCTYKCGKIFTQEKYMRKHIEVMHENTNQYRCTVCSKIMSTKSRLRNHMLRHSGVEHFICLVCVTQRASHLSCIRHHLSKKHGITGKHPLFHEAYYEMSLKEISLVMGEKRSFEECKERKYLGGLMRKSANDVNELNTKIANMSRRVKASLEMEERARVNVTQEIVMSRGYQRRDVPYVRPKDFSTVLQVEKILTAENGMKLVKLQNGVFQKMTTPVIFV